MKKIIAIVSLLSLAGCSSLSGGGFTVSVTDGKWTVVQTEPVVISEGEAAERSLMRPEERDALEAFAQVAVFKKR